MPNHFFLFHPLSWIGEGTISLNMVEEDLKFFIKWNITKGEIGEKISATQELQIAGIADSMRNELTFFDFKDRTFSVEMENVNIGKVKGKGVYDDKLIAWEFQERGDLRFEGYESYLLQEDNNYLMYAEYMTTDQFRTQIKARLRQST